MNYPEHEKMRAVKDQSQAIGQFLEWLDEQGYCIAQDAPGEGFMREQRRIEQWLADYFEIDLNKIGAEKDAMLDELRSGNAVREP